MPRRFIHGLAAFAICLTGAVVPTKPAVAETTKIRIGYPSGMNGQVPLVLQKAGLAEKHQLDAEFSSFQYGPPMLEGLVSGRLDVVITSLLPPFSLAAKGPGGVKFIAKLGHSSHSLLVPKNSAAKAIADLKGRKIGVSFSSESHLDLLLLLKQEGLDAKSDVELVNLQPGELPGAFEKSLVDAVVIRQPQTLRLEEALGARSLHTWPFYFTSIVRSDYLAKNPEAVQRYVEALKDAVFYIATRPQESAHWFAQSLRIEPGIVEKLGTENPLYSAKTRDEVDIAIDGTFKELLVQRLAAADSFRFVKGKVNPATMLP